MQSISDGIRSNKWMMLLFLLCMANLLFMHYSFRLSYKDGSEYLVYSYHWVTNFVMTIFDVTILFLVFLLFTKGRTKVSICITFAVTWLWSVINVVYGHFFHQYIPLSAFGEASSITDSMVFKSILSGLHWTDLFYLLTLTFFLLIYKRYVEKRATMSTLLWCTWILTITLVSPWIIYSAYHLANPKSRYNWELYELRMKNDIFRIMPLKDCFPNVVRFQWGCTLVTVADLYDAMKNHELSPEEMAEIREMGSRDNKTSRHERPTGIRNVIIIILESFLSAPIDFRVDGKEITPILNALKADTTVFYNDKVCPNVTIGESGDGQFIYMTGILPLRSKVTVGTANGCKLPALPSILKEQLGIKRTEIVIPGLPTVWRQDEMNAVYGIDNMLSALDYYQEVNDRELFDVAAHSEKSIEEPFLSIVLSCSTHMPYSSDIDKTFLIKDSTLPDSYKHYLNACHLADRELGKYLDDLKDKGIYDNSLIIIAADHDAHLNLLGMQGRIENYLPLFIINGQIDNKTAWHRECNQIDVYTTILDLLNIQSDWYGLGHSLLSPNYSNIIDNRKWDMSERAILGGYFFK